MSKNKLVDLNDHLFESLEMLKSGEMKPEVANQVCNIGRTLLESAKVELKYMDMMGLSKASSPLLSSITEAPPSGQRQLAAVVITYRCANHLCAWEGQQKEKDLVRNDQEQTRVCPRCKKDQFHRVVNGVVES
jgi:hypothetical protein